MLELTEAKWLFNVLAKDGRSEGGTGKLSVDTEEPVHTTNQYISGAYIHMYNSVLIVPVASCTLNITS